MLKLRKPNSHEKIWGWSVSIDDIYALRNAYREKYPRAYDDTGYVTPEAIDNILEILIDNGRLVLDEEE